jgi:uncharacterized protein (TIGR02996 family)
MTDADFLSAIAASPGDVATRLAYAGYLEEHGESAQANVIRVCEELRRVPVFCDDYWRLKACRNELRPSCATDWLAATGYDGSQYDLLFRDGFPAGWKERWRLIREFAERWHGLPMGDVGGRLEEIRAEEERLGRRLPPSVREYIAYAHDVAHPGRVGIVHRDAYTMKPIKREPALSLMIICEGNVQWAIRDTDLNRDDPPVYAYCWVAPDYSRYVPTERDQPEAESVTDFVLDFVSAYKPDAGSFMNDVTRGERLAEQLDAAFTARVTQRNGTTYEGDGMLVQLYPARSLISVSMHRFATWEQVPSFIWEYARNAHSRSGMFLNEEDRQSIRESWGDEPLPSWLGPTPPPLR